MPGAVPVSGWCSGGSASAAAGADLENGWWQLDVERSQATISSWLTKPVPVAPAVGLG